MLGKGADALIYRFEADAVGVKHGTAKIGWKAVSIDVDDINIAGALGNAFFQNLGPLVHQGVHQPLNDFLTADRPPSHPFFFGVVDNQLLNGRVGPGGTITGCVGVIAGAGLLAVASLLTDTVGNRAVARAFRQAVRQAFPLSNAPAHVETGQVAHGEGPHGQTQVVDRAIHILGQAALFKQVLGLRAVFVQHAVTDKTVTHPNHHADFLNGLADRLGRGQGLKARLGAADDFEQTHDIGRAEEMRTDDFVRARGHRSNFIHVERGRIGRQDTLGLGDRIQLSEDLLFDLHVLEHGFHNHVHLAERRVVQGRRDQSHALFNLFRREAAPLGAAVIVGPYYCQALVQKFLAGFEDGDRDTNIDEIHGNAAAHRAGTNDPNFLNGAGRGAFRHVADFRCGPLGKENMTLGSRLLAGQDLAEEFLLFGQACIKRQGAGRFDTIDATLGCLKATPRLAGLFTGGVKDGQVNAGHLVAQVSHFFEGGPVRDELTGKGFCAVEQIALAHDLVNHTNAMRLAGLQRGARGDDLKGGLGTDQTRQALGSAAAR